MPQTERGGTVAELKELIDSGQTGSKVATADPGLSPLGTDDEAAGRPPSPARVATAMADEKRIGDIARANDAPRNLVSLGVMIAVALVVAAAAVAAYLALRR